MCSLLLAAALAGSGFADSTAESQTLRRPVPLIFDTDIGDDIDDALALAMIHALMSRCECKLLAVTITKDEPMSAAFVDAVNTFYRHGHIPIGVVHDGPAREPSRYTILADQKDGGHLRYPHRLLSGKQSPEAVALLRKTLAAAEDGSVVIVQVGASTNLARLLESGKDEQSDLPGVELVKKKVRLLSVMAGSFATKGGLDQPEYNVRIDVPSAQTLVAKWPTPIVFSGFEIGVSLPYPAISIEKDFAYVAHHPVAEAYKLYEHMPYDRPTWDLTSVLYAVRPDRGYFDVSPPGRVEITKEGMAKFAPDPAGRHRFLILKSEERLRVREALVGLASQPPTP
jgi:inosine-uridine nucleoside N-ribohydrolase